MTGANAETVSIQGLSLTYRSGLLGRRTVEAIRDLDLGVRAGSVVGIVGPNGSGKSSLLRCLLGLERPVAGSARVLDAPPGDRTALRRIGYVAEARLPLGRLTAREFLTLSGALAGVALRESRQRAGDLLQQFGLSPAADRAHGDYSTGMERRLAFAAALYHRPELLVLDEPTSGMDPLGVEVVRDAVRQHAQDGGSAIVATHGLEDFEDDGFDRLVVLLEGRRVAEGSPDEVLGLPGTRDLRFSSLDDEAVSRLVAEASEAGAALERSHRGRQTLAELLASLQRGSEGRP